MKFREWLRSSISSLALTSPLLNRKTLIVALILAPSCLLLLPSEWLNPAKLPFQVALNGFSKAGDAVYEAVKGMLRFSDGNEDQTSLKESVRALETENIRLKKKIQTLVETLEGVNGPSSHAGTSGGDPDDSNARGERVLARIIGVDSSSFRKSIVIDKGARHGVVSKMPVTWKNAVVGRVADANLWTSRVALVSDPQCKIPVLVIDEAARTTAQGILEGTGDGRCRIKWIWRPRMAVSVNERVITSGILFNQTPPSPAAFPMGLLVGKVVESREEPNDLFWRVTVEPEIDFSSLDSVFVELSSLSHVRNKPLTAKN